MLVNKMVRGQETIAAATSKKRGMEDIKIVLT